MRFRIGLVAVVGLVLLALTGCSASACAAVALQPRAVARRARLSTYDLQGSKRRAARQRQRGHGRQARAAAQWTQGYELNLNGASRTAARW